MCAGGGAARQARASLTDAPFVLRFVFDGESDMTEPRFDAEPAPTRGDAVLVWVALAWVIPAATITVVELVTVGRLAPVARAVDIIAAFLLPFALLWLVLAFVQPGDEPPPDEDDNGGGRPPDDPDPVPPRGGLDIDWARFEADAYAYARSREVVAQHLLSRRDAHLGAIDNRPL